MNIKGIFLNYNNKQTHVFVGAFWALVSFWKAFACGTHHLMFVWINIFYFMDTFLSFLEAKLISFCRSVTVLHWLPSQTLLMDSLLASPRTPPPKLCILCPQLSSPLRPLRPPGCLPAQPGWRKHFCGEKKLHDAFVCVTAREGGSCLHNHTLLFLWWQLAPPPTTTTTSLRQSLPLAPLSVWISQMICTIMEGQNAVAVCQLSRRRPELI